MNRERKREEGLKRKDQFFGVLQKYGVHYISFNQDLHWRLPDYGVDVWPTSGRMAKIGEKGHIISPEELGAYIVGYDLGATPPVMVLAICSRETGEMVKISDPDELNKYLKPGFEVFHGK